MTDFIMLLMLAIFGIIGYLLMGMIDRSIERHTSKGDKPEQEKRTNEHTKTGETEHACPGLPVFLHIQR